VVALEKDYLKAMANNTEDTTTTEEN